MVPAKGASTRFFASAAFSSATVALVLAHCAARRSNSLFEMALLPISSRPRWYSALARPRSASAVRRVASSTSLSNWISGWSSFTWSPERNSTSRTVPETSAVRVTPWNALRLPMAGRRLCQGRFSTRLAVTLIGGFGALKRAIC